MAERKAKLLTFRRLPHRYERSRPRKALALCVLGLGLMVNSTIACPVPLIVYNASASAPLGFYRVFPASSIERGKLVLVKTPRSVRNLAAERGYLPIDVDLVKRVVALKGDRVCAIRGVVSIDGHAVARQLETDSKGRILPRWIGCRTLGQGEFFLLMEGVRDSFDSRYFGPVPASSIVGRLKPLSLR